MAADTQAPGGELPGDPDAAIRQLYSQYAKALYGYVEQFCPDRASADDIVQETFIRAWRHLPQLSADDRQAEAIGTVFDRRTEQTSTPGPAASGEAAGPPPLPRWCTCPSSAVLSVRATPSAVVTSTRR